MTAPFRRPGRAIPVLLVVAALLFVVGVTREANEETHADEASVETAAHREATGAEETTNGEGAGRSEVAERGESGAEPGDERVLGIDVESPLLVTAAVAVSLLLAALVWRRRDRWLFLVVAVFVAAFVVFDVAEVIHQIDGDRARLAALAAVIAAVHAAAGGVAARQAASAQRG